MRNMELGGVRLKGNLFFGEESASLDKDSCQSRQRRFILAVRISFRLEIFHH